MSEICQANVKHIKKKQTYVNHIKKTIVKQIETKYKDKGLMSKYVSFGPNANTASLNAMANECTSDKARRATVSHANIGELTQIFMEIENSCVIAEYN